MTAKSVLVRPPGLRPRARAPLAPSCYATDEALSMKLKGIIMHKLLMGSINGSSA